MSDLLPFQQCTVDWILKQFGLNRDVKRFLVADEVGLGKTKIAAEIIKGLMRNGRRNLSVVYISSSLDICHQNRKKLCADPEKQLVHADRICLLYSDTLPIQGLKIISLTPGTSLNLKRGVGNIAERAYIAKYISRRFRVPREIVVSRLKGQASKKNFEEALSESRYQTMPPKRVCVAIERAWRRTKAIDALRASNKRDSAVITKLREEMARAILQTLRPGLVILDEVQKFSDVIQTDANGMLTHSVAKELLITSVPTLLLSATPYKAFVGTNHAVAAEEHIAKLQAVFRFLTASDVQAKRLASEIAEYAEQVSGLSREKLKHVLGAKRRLEGELKKYMVRAERINFEQGPHAPYEVRKIPEEERFSITSRHLVEWVKLKDYVTSKRAFLHLWRSGHAPFSYMLKDYKIFERIRDGKHRRLRGESTVFSKPGNGQIHAKLEYLKENLLANGEIGDYLWVPPTKFYYPGSGSYAPKILEKCDIKKGLVFSSWSFVPRYVAAELSAWQNSKRSQREPRNPLKNTVRNWGRFWHPSPWLASLVCHADFLSGIERYEDLYALAKARIVEFLRERGWQITAKGALAWEVLNVVDVQSTRAWVDEIRRLFKKKRNEFTYRDSERGAALPSDQLERLLGCDAEKMVSRNTISELAHIALTSPAVCLLRTLYSTGVLHHEKVDGHRMAIISDFCARNWKMFFNRENTAKVIAQSHRSKRSFADKLQIYLMGGNIQSVLDEYIYQLQPGREENAYKEILHKLSHVFGPKGGQLFVRISRSRSRIISAEQITLFGKADKGKQSRNSIREAFNSPFWPFVLISTSVGQEGLDFHLYCKDIYHWNLPSSPVDFEQREGRINRFNSFWVRRLIAQSVKLDASPGFYWERLYTEAPKYAHRNDRFNLGMSPHWTYTPAEEVKSRGYVRHVLSLPGTEELTRYATLMKDLSLYRLTLGQPDQQLFLESLRKNEYLSKIDPRKVTLCLFPYDHKFIQAYLERQFGGKESWDLLIDDSLSFLKTLRGRPHYGALAAEVKKHIHIMKARKSKKEIGSSIAALIHFVNPYNATSDRTPGIGFDHDLERLRTANSH